MDEGEIKCQIVENLAEGMVFASRPVYIPFPGIVLKITKPKPISTIGLIEPFERGITGCKRKCPCRLWVNCGYYRKLKYNEKKGSNEEYWTEIWEYFNTAFKLTVEMPVANMNG